MAGKRKMPNLVEIAIMVAIIGLLSALAGNAALLEALATLFVGWLEWLPRLGELALRHPAITTGFAAALVILGTGLHLFLRWLWGRRDTKGSWRPLWTGSTLGIAVLLGSSSIAAIGLVHEFSWLHSADGLSANLDRKRVLSARVQRGLELAESQARRVQRHYEREGEFPAPYREDLPGKEMLSGLTVGKDGVVEVSFEPGLFQAPFASPDQARLNALERAGTLRLKPRRDGTGGLQWRCTAAFAPGFGPLNFIPDRCGLRAPPSREPAT